MEKHVTMVGLIYIGLGCLTLACGGLAALLIAALGLGGGLVHLDFGAAFWVPLALCAALAVIALTSIPGIIGGIGLLHRAKWARILITLLGVMNLMNFPFGTLLGGYTLWVLLQARTDRVFYARYGH